MSSPLIATTGRLLLSCSAAFALPLMAQESPLDLSFNAYHYWSGGPGWATIPFDHPGRPLRDAALSVDARSDGTLVVTGLAGRDSTAADNGLLAAVRLNANGSPNIYWFSGEDLRGGALPGRITWPYLFDYVETLGINTSGSSGGDIAFFGSGRVGTETFVNKAKYFSVSMPGTTIAGGLGTCEVSSGGVVRDFYALGAGMRFSDRASIGGYVRRSSDGTYLPAGCEVLRGATATQTVPDTPPSFPAGTVGALGVAPHHPEWNSPAIYSRRVIRTTFGVTNYDAMLCNPGQGQYFPTIYDNCTLFQPDIGGHLDDVLRDVEPQSRTGLIESQAESSPGIGSDRTVLSLAQSSFYNVDWNGVATSRPARQRIFALGDASSPPTSLSFHHPVGVADYYLGVLWVVMALRPFPGPDEFREIAVARFNLHELTLDTRFGGGTGWRRYSLGGAEVMPNAVAVDNQRRLVIAGSRRQSPDSDNWDFFVTRINEDVIFNDGFSG